MLVLPRVHPEHRWSKLLDRCPYASWESGKIRGAPWAPLPPSDQPSVGFEAHKSGVELLEEQPTAGQPIGVGERQLKRVEGDRNNLHVCALEKQVPPTPARLSAVCGTFPPDKLGGLFPGHTFSGSFTVSPR